MSRPRTENGEKNLISQRLIALRKEHGLSQRELAYKLQLEGYDIDKNVITRIETINAMSQTWKSKHLHRYFM